MVALAKSQQVLIVLTFNTYFDKGRGNQKHINPSNNRKKAF
jgi:hypothetical protein